MGENWTGVTWRVTLAKKDDDPVWKIAKAWNPHQGHWEHHKRVLVLGDPDKTHDKCFDVLSRRKGSNFWVPGPVLLHTKGGTSTLLGH